MSYIRVVIISSTIFLIDVMWLHLNGSLHYNILLIKIAKKVSEHKKQVLRQIEKYCTVIQKFSSKWNIKSEGNRTTILTNEIGLPM